MVRKRKLGLAFPDQLRKVSQPFGHFTGKIIQDYDWEDQLLPNYEPEELTSRISPWRLLVITLLFVIIYFGLFLRLFHLQVAQGNYNRELADTNRIQIRVIHAPRGVIYDRNGKVLSENDPGFRLEGKFISRDEALRMEAQNDSKLNQMEIDTVRFYPLAEVTAHILGFVGEISSDELQQQSYSSYKIGDHIGRAGIEQEYEAALRGIDGAEIIEIDASGRKLRTLRHVNPVPGQNIYLSIDADLQKIAFQALQKGLLDNHVCCGALVSENPFTGETLSMVSLPSYDGNAFTDPKRNDEVESFFNDPNSPLLNRVISGTYPPGSTFKMVTALAGLSSGQITQTTQIEDTGIVKLGPYSFANWYFNDYGKTEGLIDIVKALQRSNDIYFYRVGELVGEKEIAKTALRLGMGKKSGIDLPGEVSGLIPDNAWKIQQTGIGWYPGDTLHMAIGQGFVLVTPLQILMETAYFAGNGNLMQPHLVTKIVSPDGQLIKQFAQENLSKSAFKIEEINLIKKGLSLVPKEGGTAWPFFTFSVPTAGKTGTAEFGDPNNKTHAWYTSYAPDDNPRLALTVLLEKGGQGSNVAAPVAKEVYNWYFNVDKNHLVSLEKAAVATASAKLLGE